MHSAPKPWLLVALLVTGASCSPWQVTSTSALPHRPRPVVAPITERVLEVQASAYNSVPEQTDSTPSLSASGVVLEPGMRAIAVSKDLLDMGLGYGTVVRIDQVPGEWVVLDRMHHRWQRKIDLYMGVDVQAAREWGVRSVRIRWQPPEAELSLAPTE